MLGQTVTVTVDRPLGSVHPEHKGLRYPVNYGYVQGVVAQDGEEQDAYILGVGQPVAEFSGKVIAVIHRKDDVEDKLVVVPDGVDMTKDEIRKAVWFTEQYFDIEIVSSIGGVIK